MYILTFMNNAANNNGTSVKSSKRAARKVVVLDIPHRSGKADAALKGQHAVIVPGSSVRLHGERCGAAYSRSFAVGDIAEYDSYNLSYTGTIVSITEKTITIQPRSGKVRKLSLHTFSWRNNDFDAAETFRSNSEIMQSI